LHTPTIHRGRGALLGSGAAVDGSPFAFTLACVCICQYKILLNVRCPAAGLRHGIAYHQRPLASILEPAGRPLWRLLNVYIRRRPAAMPSSSSKSKPKPAEVASETKKVYIPLIRNKYSQSFKLYSYLFEDAANALDLDQISRNPAAVQPNFCKSISADVARQLLIASRGQ
jgi:hypothetical protein